MSPDPILGPGGDVGVGDGVGHALAGRRVDDLVAVSGIARRRPHLGERDALALVGEVGVRGVHVAFARELLEGDDRASREVGAVEPERDDRRSARLLGREPRCRGDLLALRVRDSLAGLAVHEGAGELVLLPEHEVLVLDGVRDGHVVGRRVVGAVLRVRRGGADLREQDRLPLVVDVGMRGHRLPALAELLERHDGVAGEPGRVELEGDLGLARGELGGELRRGGDGLAILAGHGLAGLAVHEGSRELVLLPGLEVLVLHLVRERDAPGGLGQVLPSLAGEGRGDARALVVVHGAELDGPRVARDRYSHADEPQALVGRAAELLDRIRVVGQGALGVVRRRRLAGRPAEPDSRGGVPGALAGRIVSVRARGVGGP